VDDKKIAQLIATAAIIVMLIVMLKLSHQFDEIVANNRQMRIDLKDIGNG